MMAPTKMKLRVRKRDSVAKSSQRLLANASPDSKCPICLDGFNNVASLDRCLHQFCFRCIHEWSKNKAECPLCKQPFHSIFHSVKGETDFKEFVLPLVENGVALNAAAAGDAPERVLRPRVLRGRERRSHRAQQPPAPSSSPPLEDDVMFDGLSDAAALTGNRDVHQMVLRLTARRRGRGEGRSLRRLREQDVVAFRRALYRTGVRVRSTRDVGRQRDISASFLRQNPGCLRRLLPWLQRELTVLYGSHGSLVNIVQNIIISRIMNYNMEDSAIRDELRPFLLARTDHFLHELVSFARSTLNMEAYDQQAIYDCPAPSYEEGSSSDLSVIAISEDDDDNDSEDNVTENPSAVQERLASVATASGTESLLSQSAWDDETPGPSYSNLFPSSSQSLDEGAEPSSSTALPFSGPDHAVSGSVSAGPGEDNEEEECLIVGYVKPMAERTPELVQLSSDSSEEEQEAAATETTATVMKSETSKVELTSQSHMNLLSPSSSPGPTPSSNPQRTHAVSHSREREADCLSCHLHPSKDGSWQNQDDSELRAHGRCKDRSHRREKEKAKSLEQSRHAKPPDCSPIQTCSPPIWSGQSPMVSIWSSSPASGSHGNDCSPAQNNTTQEHSCLMQEILSQSPSYSRRRKTRERRSRSPDSDSFHVSHHPRESQRCRKRRKRLISSSSADSHSERSCLDKPSGKRKYKTRHLERAAQRQHEEGTATKEKRRRRSRERSPSVEIIYERRAPEPHWHQRRKRRHRKRKRELRSPTVITIDSDSDRTIDCLDRVMDVIDQTVADVEQRDGTPERDMTQNTSCTLASSNPQSESSSPVGFTDQTTERTLNLDDCVVDVVDRSGSDSSRNMDGGIHEEFVPNPFPPAPPSDTRLLETILQDLEEFLPGVDPSPCSSSPVQHERTSSPKKHQSDVRGVAENSESKNSDGDGPLVPVTNPAS